MPQPLFALLTASVLAAAASAATPDISPDRIRHHIEILSSSDFEGRGPGTLGEEKTVAYLTDRCRELGLLPGNPDGTYIQNVPLVGIISKTETTFSIGEKTMVPAWINDYIATSPQWIPKVELKGSDIVFAGYGARPELNQ